VNKIYLILLLSFTLSAVEIPTKHVKLHAFSKSVKLNSKIIQLSNAKQSVTSLVSGHLEKYFVEAGELVKQGQKIALIESILVSKMTADYLSLKKQYISLSKNYEANKKLYEKGMLAMQDLNNLSIERNAMNSKITALYSQLETLGIKADSLKEATSNFILYAHSSGRVSSLEQPLHTVIREDEAVLSILKEQAFYVKSYLPLEYAALIKTGQKLILEYNKREIVTHIAQILPEVDVTTQRIVILSSVDERADDLFINAYVASTLYFDTDTKESAVEKSALSFFNNEWVVFVPKKEQENHEEDEHVAHDNPYEARVVKIVAYDSDFVGIKGLEVGEEYVSDKSYYVKSMLLKSSLGEHGH
jgi:multidrug efflux pump subunit AcrA (membrane-fusion protein)